MNDRELLELAAKAASRKLAQGYGQPPEKCLFYCDDDGCHDWNPLDDDGDALRLAVKLDLLNVTRFANSITVCDIYDNRYQEISDDIYAATRRAIVRAAAEIGRSMK